MIRFKKEIRACTTAFARLGDERCGFPRPRLPNSSTSNIATLAWLIRSLPSRHLERQCTHRLRDGVSGSSAVRASIQWFFRFNHWGADQKLAPFLDGRGVSSAFSVAETFQRLIWSLLSPHWNCNERLAKAIVSSEVPVLGISIQWFLHDHWALITVH